MSVRIQTTLLMAVFALALAVSALLAVAPTAQAEERVVAEP